MRGVPVVLTVSSFLIGALIAGDLTALADVADVQLSVSTDKTSYVPYESVSITIRLTNTGLDPVTLNFRDGCRVAYRVEDALGRIWYDAIYHMYCLMFINSLTFRAGEVVEYRFTWNQADDVGNQVPVPNDYIIVGYSRSYELLPEAITKITIGEPLSVRMDIQPRSDRNVVNMDGGGFVTVAVFSNLSFDARMIDSASVRFGPTGTGATVAYLKDKDVRTGESGSSIDFVDSLFYFRVSDTGFAVADTAGTLTGALVDGARVTGTATVVVRG